MSCSRPTSHWPISATRRRRRSARCRTASWCSWRTSASTRARRARTTTSGRRWPRELAALTGADGAFVSDGFGVVHRKQASVYDVAQELPAYAGGLVLAEVEVLRTLTESPERPYAVVLGGSKVSDKLAVIDALLPQVDSLLVGGGMCFTFLAAQGNGVGDSLLEARPDRHLPAAAGVRQDRAADRRGGRRRLLGRRGHRTVPADAIPDGWKGLDIGPDSVAAFAEVLAGGPHGVLERTDGRVRAGTVRRGHPRRGAGDHRRGRRSAWSAAGTPPRPSGRSAWPRTASRTSRPAVARRWSSWRARTLPGVAVLERSDGRAGDRRRADDRDRRSRCSSPATGR